MLLEGLIFRAGDQDGGNEVRVDCSAIIATSNICSVFMVCLNGG